MTEKTFQQRVAEELKDGAMSGFNDDGIEINSTGPVRKTESGNYGFDISGDALDEGAVFSGFVEVKIEHVGPSYD